MMSILERKLLDDARDRVAVLEHEITALKAREIAADVVYDIAPEKRKVGRPRKVTEALPQ